MMEYHPIEAVSAWLRNAYGATEVRVIPLDRADSILLRVYDGSGRGPRPEIEITDEALEDWSTSDIIADLELHNVIARLKMAPSDRLRYDNLRQVAVISPL